MNVQEYLQNKLFSFKNFKVTKEEIGYFSQKGSAGYIFEKITSKKYRKWSISEDTKNRVREAIAINLEKKRPLQFILPFGGYKIWRLDSAPEVDWAEFFSICYYISYLLPIVSVYAPGVTLIFSSDDVIVEQMNNIPKNDTAAYSFSFRILLEFFKSYLPDNLTLQFIRVADMYPNKYEYESELAAKINDMKESYKQLDPAIITRKQTSSLFNIRWDGAKDLSSFSDENKRDMVELGPIIHDSYCTLSKRQSFVRAKDKIVIFPSIPINNGIAIGSTKNSIVKFWTGFGIIHNRNNLLQDSIISPEQLARIKDVKHEIVSVDLVRLKNFKNIMVFDEALDFSI